MEISILYMIHPTVKGSKRLCSDAWMMRLRLRASRGVNDPGPGCIMHRCIPKLS